MPGPFPGYDPFLEHEWEDVHASLITSIRDQLNGTLPNDLVCRAEKQVTMPTSDPDDPGRWVRPDDFVAVARGFRSGGSAGETAAVLERTETFDMAADTYVAKWLEIRDRSNRDVLTTVEILSPVNKTGEREAFREKQRDLVEGGVSLVEIDLIREGRWAMYPPEDGVPDAFREPYRLCSTAVRHDGPRSRFTRVKLREPLPPIPVPLRPGEPPAVLEMQPLVDHAWTAGRYGDHYDPDPPPFPPDDAAWIAERVRGWTARGGPAGAAGGGDPEAAGGEEAGPTAPAEAG